MTDPATERWLPVPAYPGYEVSDRGRVRSITRTKQTSAGPRVYRGRMLKPCINSRTGYPQVHMGRGRCPRTVHQLVLEAFAGPCPPGMEALHGPAGKLDTSLANLSYGTRGQNLADRVRDGQDARGERNYHAKLTRADVTEIRRRKAAGELLSVLAAEFGVSFQHISLVARGRRWQHVPL